MARSRKPSPQRKRRVSQTTSYANRNARARALGYADYYDYRAHDNGRIPPGEPRLKGEKLRKARGHASAADLAREAKDGDLLIASAVVWYPQGRAPVGQWDRRVRIDITLNKEDGGLREYTLHGRERSKRVGELARRKLTKLVATLEGKGVVFSPAPSLDLRRMAASPGDE